MTCEVPKPRPRGILCPDCAEPMRVAKTRRHFGVLSRRRVCRHCGRRLTTEERPRGDRQGGTVTP